MKRNNKIKFINFKKGFKTHSFILDRHIVCNPTQYKSVPDGEYLIRGEFRYHAKYYIVKDNVWYLVNEMTSDEGRYMHDAARYEFYPNLPEKEWILISKSREKLNKYWERALCGWETNKWLNEIHRDAKARFLKYPELAEPYRLLKKRLTKDTDNANL